MRLRFLLGLTLIIGLHHVYCQRQGSQQLNPTDNNYLDLVSNSVTNLAQKISRAISNPRSKTEIFSPVSIAGALSLLLLGSSGTTREELTKLMGFENSQINFGDIHKSFGMLFRELVSPQPSINFTVPWRVNDKCNNYDYEDEDTPSNSNTGGRGKRDTSPTVEKSIGNGIFVQNDRTFGERYKKLAEVLYQTVLQYVDFNTQQSVSVINNWVRNQTRGRIPEIVSQLSSETLMVIANTLYFKAEWEEPFLKDGTKPRPFYPNGPSGPEKNVPMMVHGGCFPYYYWKEADVKVLGIPYKKDNTMYVFMPNNSTRDKLKQLHTRLNADTIDQIIAKMEVKTVSLQFPKMHLLNSFNLKQVLEQLGVYRIFDHSNTDLEPIINGRFDQIDVDDFFDALEDTVEAAQKKLQESFDNCSYFTEKEVDNRGVCNAISYCRYGGTTCVCCPKKASPRQRRQTRQAATPMQVPLYVNEIVHKVDVTVNEKGTEGGAVTATLLDRITSQVIFRANGPFAMIIRDEATKLPLFYGNVFDPTI